MSAGRTNRAMQGAKMARYMAEFSFQGGIGPFIGPSWPDSVARSKETRLQRVLLGC